MPSQAVKLSDGGALVIPVQFREMLGLDTGDTVVVELADGGLTVHSLSAAIRRAQQIVRAFSPKGESLADSLIADRRIEADRE